MTDHRKSRQEIRETVRALSDRALSFQAGCYVGGIAREEIDAELQRRAASPDLYIVWDAETNEILAADRTLTEACRIRDSIETPGHPRVARQARGDREGGPAERDDRGMVTL